MGGDSFFTSLNINIGEESKYGDGVQNRFWLSIFKIILNIFHAEFSKISSKHAKVLSKFYHTRIINPIVVFGKTVDYF